MTSLDPITISSAIGSVDLSGASGNDRVREVKVANRSGFALRIQIGGGQHWLEPWMADVFPAQGAKSLTYEPAILTPLGGQSTLPGMLFVTVAVGQECIPGVYPSQIASSDSWGSAFLCQVSVQRNSTVRVITLPMAGGAITDTQGGDVVSPTILPPLPASVRGIALMCSSGSFGAWKDWVTSLIIEATILTGDVQFFSTTNGDVLPPRMYLAVPVDLSNASQIKIVLTPDTNATNITVSVVALTDLQAVTALPLSAVAPLRPAGLATAQINTTQAPSTTAAIVAGVVNKKITVWGVRWNIETSAAGAQSASLQDAHSNFVDTMRVNTQAPVSNGDWFPSGIPLFTSDPLNLVTGGGPGNVDAGGVVFYTQLPV